MTKTKKMYASLAMMAFLCAGVAITTLAHASSNDAVFVTTAAQPTDETPWETCNVSFSNGDTRAPLVIFQKVPVATNKKQKELGMNTHMTGGSPVMLFSWEHEDYRPFWMKGVVFPLTVASINKAGRVTQIEAMKPETEKTHWSNEKVVAALEVVPPTLAVLGVKVGSQMHLDKCPNLVTGVFDFEK